MSAVLTLVELEADGVALVSLEALTLARRLGGPLEAVLIGAAGPVKPDVLEELGAQGVSVVHVTEDERLTAYAAAAWASVVVEVAHSTGARAVVAAGTIRGNEVLAHVAARLGVAMAANVTEVDSLDPLVVSRQVVGGAALEECRLGDSLAVLSVAGHALDPEPADHPTTPEVVAHTPGLSEVDLVARVSRVEAGQPSHSAALATSRVVVGAGRGAGGPEGFTSLLELTDLLGGALGVSRVVTSLGWRPHHEQVGQTGSRVSPELYLACGISGAIQHWAGMSSSKTIVAINTDEEAPMVTRAHYAVIGDLHEVVPAVVDEIRRRKG